MASQEKLKLEESVDVLKKIIDSNRLIISKLQFELGHSKDSVAEKEIKIFNLQYEFRECKNKLRIAKDNIEKQRETLQNETNRKLMLNEDLDSCIVMIANAKRNFDALKSDFDQLKLAIIEGKDTSHFELEVMVPLNDPIFDVSKSTSGLFFNHKASAKSPTPETIESLNLSKFKYSRPSMAQIIGIPDTHQARYSPPFPNWINIVIRGIYDSKFFEHLICGASPFRLPSRFPDFVHS